MNLPAAVVCRIGELFREGERGGVADLLGTYGTESWERERERVLLDVLLLSGGDFSKLHGLVLCAKRDYRDILLWAEYPEESRLNAPQRVGEFNGMLRRFGADGRITEGGETLDRSEPKDARGRPVARHHRLEFGSDLK